LVQKPSALAGTDFSHKHGVKNDENGPKQGKRYISTYKKCTKSVKSEKQMIIQGEGISSAIRLCGSSAPLSNSTGGSARVPKIYVRKSSTEVWRAKTSYSSQSA
jgi:hypothetical protein